MDYLRRLFKVSNAQKATTAPLPSRSEMFGELVNRFTAGYSFTLGDTLPDPDPILRKLGRIDEVYRQVRADSKVAACIAQRKSGVTSLNWGLNPGNDNQQQTEILEAALHTLDMTRIISEMLDAVLYGFCPLEIMWEYRDGFILPRDIVGKPPLWFCFDSCNRLRFRAAGYVEGVELPRNKFLLVQHQSDFQNPYGQKVLSSCFWPVTFKKQTWRWWVDNLEKFGTPLILSKIPRGTDVAEQEQLLDNLERLVQDAISVIPNDSDVQILQNSDSANKVVHQTLIDKCNAEIALAILGETLTSEVGDTGSYAASKTHNDVRGDLVDSDRHMVENAMQQLVNMVFAINWGSIKPPAFSMWHDADIDKELAERDKILTETGLKFTKSYYLRAYGFEEEDFDLSAPEPKEEVAEFAASESTSKAKKKGDLTDSEFPFEANDPADVAYYKLDGQELSDLGKALLRPIMRLIEEGSDCETVLKKIRKSYPAMQTKALEDAIARCYYIHYVTQ